ncbi:MAG TPA: hypothetical protein VKA14_00255 [Gammaproteobacteria bacterium]|nr:hypothetical protein [Gammaproteobacteria bacterium]
MDAQTLNQRCVELMNNPDVQHRMWHPRMFWKVGALENPRPGELTSPKVDLEELEVLLASAAHQKSQCLEDLNKRIPGRGDLIVHMVRRGDMPLLARPAP